MTLIYGRVCLSSKFLGLAFLESCLTVEPVAIKDGWTRCKVGIHSSLWNFCCNGGVAEIFCSGSGNSCNVSNNSSLFI